MELNKILSSDILDILFDGRNKEYGAYDLRKTYNTRMRNALIGMGLVSFIFMGYNLIDKKDKKDDKPVFVQDMSLEKLKEPPPPEPPPPPPPPKQEPPKIEVAQFTPPKIVPKEEVKEPPPDQEKLEKAAISDFNQKGEEDKGVVEAPKEVTTGGTGPVEEDYNKFFAHVEIEAEFPGGIAMWRRYLERNLNQDVPKDNGAPPGKYTVEVYFVVDREGNISDVKGTFMGSGEDYGVVAEAVKAVTRGGKWKPGIQNGNNVKSPKRQPITFVVNEE
ncbi:MAG: energy transducer TonB [Bacteroidetes bacterium]|jgi:protein TonB|nr:energy transducer TonB [Bacteroidota bacterium]